MKHFFLTSIIILLIVSCKKETLHSTTTINQSVDTTATLELKGSFVNGPFGNVSGSAEIYKKQDLLSLKLSSFNTSNGPALHVYLSKEAMPVNFIDLGAIQSTNGNQVYNISGMPLFSEYKYVSIHCVAYNHLFGYALIK